MSPDNMWASGDRSQMKALKGDAVQGRTECDFAEMRPDVESSSPRIQFRRITLRPAASRHAADPMSR